MMSSPSQVTPLRAEVARKAIHLATAGIPIAWSFQWLEARTLKIALAVAASAALATELLRFASPRFSRAFDAVFGALLRAHERRAVSGATWLALGMTAVAWLAPSRAAVIALWAAAVGDAAAALVGRAVARLRGAASTQKSLSGSFAAALSTTLGAIWLVAAPLWIALTLGAVAAAAEWPTRPLDDNVRIVGAVALAAVVLGLR
jgi:dolichol kinase